MIDVLTFMAVKDQLIFSSSENSLALHVRLFEAIKGSPDNVSRYSILGSSRVAAAFLSPTSTFALRFNATVCCDVSLLEITFSFRIRAGIAVMAAKEATVYIVDCGSTMGETSLGRQQSNLDWALKFVWDKITTAVSTGRKTLFTGVVGLRTDDTNNGLSAEDSFRHISVLQDLGQILMPQLRRLRNELVVSHTQAGDAISALVVAIQMIINTCRKLQYIRKIVLLTDGRASMDGDGLADITSKLKEDNIELIVLGIDFDDADFGFKEEDKPATKAENETLLKTLCEDCNGTFGTLAQAIDELQVPRVKSTKPTPLFKGKLTLGNPEEYDTALSIDVEEYPKVLIASAPSASKFVMRGDISQPTQTSATLSNGENGANDGLTAVSYARSYQVEDENAAGGMKDVQYDELAKGYEYGRTAVHISESDRNVTTYETSPGLDILGFVDQNQYERCLELGRAALIIASRNNDQASMALSALIHALYELESYAIGRFVSKENKEPKMTILAPNIDSDFECLYVVELPFAEDIRQYKFPPLDRVMTVSGKVLKVHRNLPSDELLDAMSAYVDSMDLSNFGKDDEGEDAEYAALDDTYAIMLHRLNQVIKHRAVHTDSEPPPPSEILTKYQYPPAELAKQSQRALDKVVKAADVKKVPPKARGKRFGRKGREEPKPLSDLDIGALLAQDPQRKSGHIDPRNAIPEFKQIFESIGPSETQESELKDAVKQLKQILFDWIRHSTGSSGYGQAIEALRVMREESLDFEVPELFNDALKDLKEKVFAGNLGGDRKEMWLQVRQNRLGLITKKELSQSEITEEEAKAFMVPK